MRSVWAFLTNNLDLVLSAIYSKYFSPVKEVRYLEGKSNAR